MGQESAIGLWEQFSGLDEIWAVGRRKDRLEKLEEKVNIPVRKFALDLSQEKDRELLKEELVRLKPQVKFLVNAVTTMVLPFMPQNSRILQFASSAAFLPQPGFAVYAASKAYVLSYSRALNRELKSRKIFVTAVCPGPVRTEFFDIAQTTGEIPLYKKLVMADPGKVVAKAIRDSIAGREVSVYGIWMKVFWVLAKVFPHSLILDIMEKIEYAPGKERW